MSDAPRKRPWLQFHLSTAIVLMFVAGGLMWMNMRDRGSFLEQVAATRHGWPFAATEKTEYYFGSGSIPFDPDPDPHRTRVSVVGVVADCLVALAILCVVGVLCERLIRRRERRP